MIRHLRTRTVLVLLLLAAPGFPAPGRDRAEVLGASDRTGRRLQEIADKEKAAREKPSDERWAEVVDELQALLGSAGNDLVSAEDGRCVPARWVCHARLAGLPAAVLARYRLRVERQAQKWLEQGKRERDPVPLRRVVDEAFCSRAAEAALDLLGDLAFEDGHFEKAEHWWGRLVPLEPPDKDQPHQEGDPPVYPDPQGDPARIRAKQLLARWFVAGHTRPAEWRRLLEDFRKRHPRAEGHLAGERGLYWKRLDAVATQERDPPAALAHGAADGWHTFAGSPSRNRILPGESLAPERLSALCRHGRHWRFALGPDEPDSDPPAVKSVAEAARSLAFHPVIAGRHVLVADARYLSAIDIETGKRQRWYDAAPLTGTAANLKLPAPPDLRYTLTVADDCVLARVGVQDLRSDRSEKETKDATSFLVCLGLRPDAKGEHLRWRVAPGPRPGDAIFEGTAIVSRGHAYIAATRFEGARAITTIHCYPLDARGVAPLRWKQDVCAARDLQSGERRYRHHLLTLIGPNVVYCSHSGVIAALDATTGRRVWAVRYQQGRTEEEKPPAPRDLCPPVYADGKLFVAPADSNQVLCLDPLTGRRLWLRDRVEAVQLLGVGQGRLIFTTITPKPGLRALDADDGSDSGGWFHEAPGEDGTGRSFGRGFLAGDLVYWPTYSPKSNRIYVVTQKTGEQPDDPTLLDNLPVGNLAFADGTFVIAGRTHLDVYAPPRTRLDEREAEVREHPDSARAHFHLGTAQADAGAFARAEESFREAERLATDRDRVEGERLRDAARRERHRVLLRSAEVARSEKRWDDAAAELRRAGATEFPAAGRLRAVRALCDLWLQAGNPGRAAIACQSVLSDRTLQRGHLIDSADNPQSARQWAVARLDGLLRSHPKEVSAALAELLKRNAPAANLEALAEEFPHVESVRSRLFELARQQEKAGQLVTAAQTYRTLLRLPEKAEDRNERTAALVGLGRVYALEGATEAARGVLGRLLQEEAWDHFVAGRKSRVVSAVDSKRTVLEWVIAELTRAVYRTPAPGPLPLSVPLFRRWHAALPPEGTFLLPAADDDARRLATRVFSHHGTAGSGRLGCRDAATGKVLWERAVPVGVSWAGVHADMVLAAGRDGLVCLGIADGHPLWEYPTPPWWSGHAPPLSAFRLLEGRLYFLQGERRLYCLDAETGHVLWTRWAPGAVLRAPDVAGRFAEDYRARERTVELPDVGWLLDARTGRTIRLLDRENHAVSERDAETGADLWRYDISGPTTLTGERPQRVALSPANGGRSCLLIVFRNYGATLERLDDGRPRWQRPAVLRSGQVWGPGVSYDATAAYVVHAGRLVALSLEDGRQLWDRPLAGGASGKWRTERAGDYLLAYPIPRPGVSVPVPLTFGLLKGGLLMPPEERPGTGFSVFICDPTTGNTVQRLNLPAGVPRLWARWGDEPGPAGVRPAVGITSQGIVVLLGAQAWGLTASD